MCIVSVCRLGYTGRCTAGLLFGCDALDGGQAQYVRVPKAGSTLFSLSKPTWNSTLSGPERAKALAGLNDSSLLLLADILPTGVFAAIQATSHPKVLPMINGLPWPYALNPDQASDLEKQVLTPEDRLLVFAIVGLGPVGICAAVSLLDVLARRQLPYKIVAIDPLEARREKMKAVYDKIGSDGKGQGEFAVASIDEAKALVQTLTGGIGCTAVLEVGELLRLWYLNSTACVDRWQQQRDLACIRPCSCVWSYRLRRRTRRTVCPIHRSSAIQQECFFRLREMPSASHVSSRI